MYLPINLQNVSSATGFDYPPGYYLMQVDKVEIRTNQDGQGQRLLVHNTIIMGPQQETKYQGRKLANSYQLTEKGAPFLKRMFLSCGITDDFIAQNGGNVDPEWLAQRQYVCQVVKNSGYTNITNERPMDEWDAMLKQAGGASPTPHIQTPPTAAAPTVAQPSMLQPVAAPMAAPQPVAAAPTATMPPVAGQPPMAAPQPVAAPPMAAPQPVAAPPMAAPPMAAAPPAAAPAPAGISAPPPPPGVIPGQ